MYSFTTNESIFLSWKMATTFVSGGLGFPTFFLPSHSANSLSIPYSFSHSLLGYSPKQSLIKHAKKRSLAPIPVSKQKRIAEEEQIQEQEDDGVVNDYENEILVDESEDFFVDEFEAEESELYVGDGGGGGGVMLSGTWWDKEALALAEKASMSFDGDLKIYAFKTSANFTIQARIEKVSTKYGSPTLADVEDFSKAYRKLLEEAEQVGTIPENMSLEVSSPGLERIVRIPQDLERFKDLPMYVKYIVETATTDSTQEKEAVLKLVSFDVESGYCTWGLANVRINREQAGKGRPLSKKQKEWRLQTPFDSLRLVRLFSEF